MATVIRKSSGKKVVLLTPSEKAKRYARQMKNGKISETGKKLTKVDYAWRAGYLAHQKDETKAFKAKHPRYKRKTKN